MFAQHESHCTVLLVLIVLGEIEYARSVQKTLHRPHYTTTLTAIHKMFNCWAKTHSLTTRNCVLQTSREERLAKAEAPSEASLLLASWRERLPGSRRCRGGREERPRLPQSTTRPSEEQIQGGGQEEACGNSTARRQRAQRKAKGANRLGEKKSNKHMVY